MRLHVLMLCLCCTHAVCMLCHQMSLPQSIAVTTGRMPLQASCMKHCPCQQSINHTPKHISLVLQPPPEDTSTELDPKYKVAYLSGAEAAAHAHRHQDPQEEAVAAAYALSQLEASLSGVPVASNIAEANARMRMTASTSGTTVANKQSKMTLRECLIWQNQASQSWVSVAIRGHINKRPEQQWGVTANRAGGWCKWTHQWHTIVPHMQHSWYSSCMLTSNVACAAIMCAIGDSILCIHRKHTGCVAARNLPWGDINSTDKSC